MRHDHVVEMDEFINDVNDLATLLLTGNRREYDVGLELLSLGMQGLGDQSVGSVAAPIDLIWASLTDLVDGPRGGEPGAEASARLMMIRAASEWLAISSDETERELYFDRWLYEECGYERR